MPHDTVRRMAANLVFLAIEKEAQGLLDGLLKEGNAG